MASRFESKKCRSSEVRGSARDANGIRQGDFQKGERADTKKKQGQEDKIDQEIRFPKRRSANQRRQVSWGF